MKAYISRPIDTRYFLWENELKHEKVQKYYSEIVSFN